MSFSDDEISTIKEKQFDTVKANYVRDCGGYKTVADLREEVKIDVDKARKAFVKDGFYNPGSGIGTPDDVGNWGRPYEPLLVGPYDASAMYSSGGLSQIIIDKKSRGLVISGYQFSSGAMDGMELLELRDYAESFGFSAMIAQAARDALLFGGSALYPILKGESALTTAMSFQQLLEKKLLKRDCLDYFAEADRWNLTVVPDYDLSAKDYLNPRTFLVPISGIEVNSDRAAFVRTKPLPYWSAIRQLGWGASDIAGWAKSLIGYEIMAMSLPIMCQQMSLLVHTLPLDGHASVGRNHSAERRKGGEGLAERKRKGDARLVDFEPQGHKQLRRDFCCEQKLLRLRLFDRRDKKGHSGQERTSRKPIVLLHAKRNIQQERGRCYAQAVGDD